MGFLINDEKKSEIIKSSDDLEISRLNDIYLSGCNENDEYIANCGNNLNTYGNGGKNNDMNKIKNVLANDNYAVETTGEDATQAENKDNNLTYDGTAQEDANGINNSNNININVHENNSGDINISNNFLFDKENENICSNNTSATTNNANMETQKDSNSNEDGNLLINNNKLNEACPNSNSNNVINKTFNKNMRIFRATPYNTNESISSIKKKIKKKINENDYLFCTINKFLRDGLKNECIPLFESNFNIIQTDISIYATSFNFDIINAKAT
ncbi:conserved Plasmodium protein, unknown function [Plasmodium vinckei brucechwatti]|uniref:Uncharacterized protein n=1 Tax=Plasmodium vinckei brucechwatti TaxID=119398 RepID=A0A6V7SRD1_PLAVN|nr:conserved Plasmodium protein, unknown function [Plasmodium vinckei brucechwatti]